MAYQMDSGGGSGSQFVGQPFGDTTYTKVFIGGLAWETQNDSLRRYFEQFGDIVEAAVITDKHTGRSKGYGFVTYCDPEAARRACANPNPVIDGRRANCNLAALGRRFLPYGRLRSSLPHHGGPQTMRDLYAGSPVYQPVPYSYQPGFPYPSYRYPLYGPEYMYQQIYGMPGTVGTNTLRYGQLGAQLGSPPCPVRGYIMPAPQMVQYQRPCTSGTTTDIPKIQLPHQTGITVQSPGQSQIPVLTHPPQFTESSGSDQMAG